MTAAYLDPRSGATFPLDVPRWCGPGHAPLLLTTLLGIARGQIDRSTRSLWRYRAALPMQVADPITMGEGCTPLLPRTLHGASALLKCEWFMPTGSFKDRGASVMLSLLRAQGVRAVLEDSSGNGGAAVAAYAAAGGLQATIMAPASTSPAKTVQMRAHGAAVELIPGSRQDTADAAVSRSETVFYASHNWQPFFIEGTKTLAFELLEQLGFTVPDNILVPTGYGSNILGLDRGFDELRIRSEIDHMPRLFAVQAANCAAFAASWRAGKEAYVPFTAAPTMADGIATMKPIRIAEVLTAVQRSGGRVVTVAEDEIAPALRRLGRLGLYVEPTAATVGVALSMLLADGTISPGETTVAVLTGHGLKASEKIGELLGN